MGLVRTEDEAMTRVQGRRVTHHTVGIHETFNFP